jgi:hypothetical protein
LDVSRAVNVHQWRIQGLYLGGGANLKLAGDFHGERGSASLYGGLGALPPVGSRGKAPGQGVRGGLKPFTQLLLQFLVEIRLYF